jgi:hypothetical protein
MIPCGSLGSAEAAAKAIHSKLSDGPALHEGDDGILRFAVAAADHLHQPVNLIRIRFGAPFWILSSAGWAIATFLLPGIARLPKVLNLYVGDGVESVSLLPAGGFT